MFFTAFPIVFQEGRGWSTGVGGLAFLGLAGGMILGEFTPTFRLPLPLSSLSTLTPSFFLDNQPLLSHL